MALETTTKSILIAESDIARLDMLRTALLEGGYAITTATDGPEALEKIRAEKPAACLVSLVLTSLDGLTLLHTLHEEGIAFPIIVLASETERLSDINQALELGARDYVSTNNLSAGVVLEKLRGIFEPATNLPAGASLPLPSLTKNQGTTILVVEDDKFLRDLIIKKIASEGFATVEAPDGEAGIRLMQEKPPQLVLLDLLLPGIDGFEVLRRIKADPNLAHIPVVILSNLGQEEDINKGKSLGAVEFLVKAKYTPQEIVARAKEILNSSYVNQ